METQNKNPKVVAFDFDGVIASYNGFVGHNDIKEPIPETIDAIRTLKSKGYKILIYSTRGDNFLKQYCERFSIPIDYINRRPDKEGENPGKPVARVYVDDNCVLFKRQSAEMLVAEIENFKPYWKTGHDRPI